MTSIKKVNYNNKNGNKNTFRKQTSITSERAKSTIRSSNLRTKFTPKSKNNSKIIPRGPIVTERARRAISNNPVIQSRINDNIRESNIEKRRTRKDRKKIK